jgi:tetratricopeptide (TPR) repeat protein
VPAWLDRVLDRGLRDAPDDRFASMSALLAALQFDRHAARKRRRFGLVLALVLPAVLAMAWRWTRPGPTAAQVEALAELERDARALADAGRYIYPPPEDPARPTAYSTVMLMEAMPPEIDAMAEAKARELRQTFAADLVASADRLWDRPGGRVFAIDAYAAALVFDPAEPRARERAGLTVAELAQLRAQAQALAFSPAELESAQVMARVRASESAPDETLWAEVAARERPLVIAGGLSAMMGAVAREAPAPASPASPTESVAPGAATESPTVDAHGDTASAATPSAAALAREEPRAHRRKDADTTAATLRGARAALDAAELDEAERAFLRVVAEQPRSVAAHAGLGEVEFERGAYPKAILHLQRAIALAPRNVINRVLLGDALLKVHRYREARDQYREAAELGSSTASERARLLDAKLGSSG